MLQVAYLIALGVDLLGLELELSGLLLFGCERKLKGADLFKLGLD